MSNLYQTKSTKWTNDHMYELLFYHLGEPKDFEAFNSLLENTPGIEVKDELYGQLVELVKLHNPRIEHTPESIDAAIEKHLDGCPIDEYGVWVYYPWRRQVVHILDESEFVQARTNRNHYKITPQEQEELSKKKIAVIGLSVGKSVAKTIAMERSCGELRLADFDKLELTNLNRIQSNILSLELPKATIVAREIAELDPFFKVKVFFDGVTEENIEEILFGGGQLDMMIEECDSVFMKFHIRHLCKKAGIPVLMDTSDRGMLDIERFDLDPERPIFHGLVEHLDYQKSRGLTKNEDKVPYVLPIIGKETISLRMKASMVEVDYSLKTWPQLSSAVAYGGGMTADISRRILLGENVKSGRFFADTNEIFDINEDIQNNQKYSGEVKAQVFEIPEVFQSMNIESDEISESDLEEIIDAILKSPSSGNMQPWFFEWDQSLRRMAVFLNKPYGDSFGDYNDLASLVSIGCALSNAKCAAAKKNYFSEFHHVVNSSNFMGYLSFHRAQQLKINSSYLNLSSAINKRTTTRFLHHTGEVSNDTYSQLSKVVNLVEGASLTIIDDRQKMNQLAEVIARADQLRFLNLNCHEEFYTNEVRWTEKEAKEKGDGLDMTKFHLNLAEYTGFEISSDRKVVEKLNEWEGGEGFGKLAYKGCDASASYGLITMEGQTESDYINGGIACENLWLQCAIEGIGLQPQSSPPYFFARLIQGKGEGFSLKEKIELEQLRKIYTGVFPEIEGKAEILLFRLTGKADEKISSFRRKRDDSFRFTK